ncbi:dpy-30 motif domain-containing protein [Hirsutella rhossiliensis]|uniref:Dpy-30 motif domain-containing protein n=1 Tax=Hirsutella rhossiliensis TaxID=111463 RepID=A0A9P8SHM2_9HYPO|nr:dpy-30 motif domain-containing protein [Hirsutella rhossiliensis]KAH0963273.1 dpy-30 motif domain-containing protein [Hirsutella rhossiliensis]
MADDVSKPETMLEVPQVPATNDAAIGTNLTQQTQPTAPPGTPHKDVVMSDAPIEQAASPAPARTGTPAQGSRAASAHPDANLTMPSEAVPHGDPTRRYLNTKVTGVLLEGMKQLAKDQPHDPLRVLGEFLIQKSKELEKIGQA